MTPEQFLDILQFLPQEIKDKIAKQMGLVFPRADIEAKLKQEIQDLMERELNLWCDEYGINSNNTLGISMVIVNTLQKAAMDWSAAMPEMDIIPVELKPQVAREIHSTLKMYVKEYEKQVIIPLEQQRKEKADEQANTTNP